MIANPAKLFYAAIMAGMAMLATGKTGKLRERKNFQTALQAPEPVIEQNDRIPASGPEPVPLPFRRTAKLREWTPGLRPGNDVTEAPIPGLEPGSSSG